MIYNYSDSDGGIFWDDARTYKASISNELFITLASKMYKVTKNETYLEHALITLNWFFEDSGLVQEDGRILDGFHPSDGSVSTEVWTYN